MQAHRADDGNIYSLGLGDPENESRNFILLNDSGKYIPVFCRHCAMPECVMSCMSGALEKDLETGHVRYDEKLCAECFMCVMGCPYGVPKPDRHTSSRVIKCDFCKDDPEGPNCVRACPKKTIRVEEVAGV